MASDKVTHISDATFESEVLKASDLVLVDFWAEWCAPCRMVAPILEDLAAEYDTHLKVVKLNVDDNREAAGRYGIRSIPTLLFFRNGKQVDQLIGALPKSAVKSKIDSLL